MTIYWFVKNQNANLKGQYGFACESDHKYCITDEGACVRLNANASSILNCKKLIWNWENFLFLKLSFHHWLQWFHRLWVTVRLEIRRKFVNKNTLIFDGITVNDFNKS